MGSLHIRGSGRCGHRTRPATSTCARRSQSAGTRAQRNCVRSVAGWGGTQKGRSLRAQGEVSHSSCIYQPHALISFKAAIATNFALHPPTHASAVRPASLAPSARSNPFASPMPPRSASLGAIPSRDALSAHAAAVQVEHGSIAGSLRSRGQRFVSRTESQRRLMRSGANSFKPVLRGRTLGTVNLDSGAASSSARGSGWTRRSGLVGRERSGGGSNARE